MFLCLFLFILFFVHIYIILKLILLIYYILISVSENQEFDNLFKNRKYTNVSVDFFYLKMDNREVHIWSVVENGIDLYLEENRMEENEQWRRMESDFLRKMAQKLCALRLL